MYFCCSYWTESFLFNAIEHLHYVYIPIVNTNVNLKFSLISCVRIGCILSTRWNDKHTKKSGFLFCFFLHLDYFVPTETMICQCPTRVSCSYLFLSLRQGPASHLPESHRVDLPDSRREFSEKFPLIYTVSFDFIEGPHPVDLEVSQPENQLQLWCILARERMKPGSAESLGKVLRKMHRLIPHTEEFTFWTQFFHHCIHGLKKPGMICLWA